MTDYNQFHEGLGIDPAPVKKKLPDMLNVLTILTFIGCGFYIISGLFSYFTICSSIQRMEELSELSKDNPFGNMIESSMAAAHQQCALKTPILIITLLGNAISLFGAIAMRRTQKSGFYVYTIGELGFPIASSILLASTMTTFSYVATFLFPILFVVLYATQLKHMK